MHAEYYEQHTKSAEELKRFRGEQAKEEPKEAEPEADYGDSVDKENEEIAEHYVSAVMKKSEDKSEYLKKRNAELGGKCSKLEHGKRLEESVNEGLRAENLRLHDELQRERSQIQRDIEARKREEDNKMQSRNKAHKRVMDKDEQHQKQELACINETISEKNE